MIPFPRGRARVLSLSKLRDVEEWKQAFDGKSKDHRFYEIVEETINSIYDDYLGLDYAVALDLHLYFYTLRDIISWALAQGLQRYRSSPLNYHPKLHLGCDLFPLDLYVMHTTPLLNKIFRQALRFMEPTRHDPVLKRFRNAHELHGNAK